VLTGTRTLVLGESNRALQTSSPGCSSGRRQKTSSNQGPNAGRTLARRYGSLPMGKQGQTNHKGYRQGLQPVTSLVLLSGSPGSPTANRIWYHNAINCGLTTRDGSMERHAGAYRPLDVQSYWQFILAPAFREVCGRVEAVARDETISQAGSFNTLSAWMRRSLSNGLGLSVVDQVPLHIMQQSGYSRSRRGFKNFISCLVAHTSQSGSISGWNDKRIRREIRTRSVALGAYNVVRIS